VRRATNVNMAAAPPILVLVQDLFFRAKIEGTARAAGRAVRCVADASTLPEGEAWSGCLVDLESAGAASLRALPAIAARMATIAFASHGRADLFAAARAAGCRELVPRSALGEQLPAMLARLAGEAAS